jgi:GINS complex subunit 1
MNYGSHARELMLELARSNGNHGEAATTSTATIPPYNDERVRLALQDMQLHIQALNDQYLAVKAMASEKKDKKSTPLEIRPSILLQNSAVLRHKRALLTYHYVRVQRLIDGGYWQQQPLLGNDTAPVGEEATQPSSMKKQQTQDPIPSNSSKKRVLCPAESDFYRDYQQLVANYTAQVLPDFSLDALRAYTGSPPTPSDHVLVRVVQASASDNVVVLESGQTVNLGRVGSTHYLLWSDVEEYVRSGHLMVLSSE